MKKLLTVILPLVIIVLLLVFVLHRQAAKTLVDDRFGFLRNAFDLDLEKIEETGAIWFRPNFGPFAWGNMQKDEDASIDFSKTDGIVRDAQEHGLHLLVTLFPFADWDQKANAEKCKVSANDEMLPRSKEGFEIEGLPYYRCNPNNWDLYEKWLTAVVKRYDGDGQNDMSGLKDPILFYEIGNEPDLTKDPKSDSGTVFYLGTPQNYAELLQKSYATIKAADNKTQILTAAPAGVQPEFVKFWERVFSTPKIADYFDIANIHCISAPNQDQNDPTSVSAGDLNVTVYKNLLLSFQITKSIWVTEAEDVQGNNVSENVQRLKESVTNALKNGARKIFFTGASFANDPMRYTSEIFTSEKGYYKEIISAVQ